MRMVIKGADFSAVSIGKVVEDLSFAIHGNSSDELSYYFVGYDGETHTPTDQTYYTGKSGADAFTTTTNANRIKTILLPVIQGMKIVLTHVENTNAVPMVVAFDTSKNPIPAKSYWHVSGNSETYTVPAGVDYISVQIQPGWNTSFFSDSTIIGSMPEE